ncbi:MAG: TonB-dependent receptor plug domain-containing protein [Bacteroidales bacterium]|nr:TonB-dependent receptor plug domain-containing protein [Bacteroidales bacterium]
MKTYLLYIILILTGLSVAGQTDDTLNIKSQSPENIRILITESALENEEQSQDISGLLQSSQDIFVSTAGFTFGQTRFKIRGFDSEYSSVLMNGIPLNDMETGRAYWSSWGGLNDATRNKEINNGIAASDYSFGGVGGSSNMITRASSFRKNTRLTYSLTNRNYRNRLMFIHSTGMMDNGWALTVSGSRRWAQEGYVEGTFYDAWSYFLSAEKKLNKKHSLGIVAFGAPSKSGRGGVSTQETYDLAGSNYYNPYWGYQNGEKRNSRVNNYNQPMVALSHYWTMAEKTNLTTSVYYSFGRGGGTALDWYDAADPRPDYYRNLPSWDGDVNGLTPAERQYLWENNTDFRQINWDYLYFVNRKNLYTVGNVDGVEGKTYTGNLSNYIIEERRNDRSQLGLTMNYKKEFSDHIIFSSGINLLSYQSDQYKTVVDLLGGDFYLDIDKYAERDFFDPILAQNDLNHPNRVVKEGDVFGYDYTANVNYFDLFAQSEFTYAKVDFYIAASLSGTGFWRTGHMKTGKFPDNSFGDSEKQNFMNPGVKAGMTYKITGRHFASINALFMSRAPSFRNSYISPRTRDDVVDNLTSEKVMSADASYIYRSPYIKFRATGYFARIEDQVYLRSFYHEVLRSFGNYLMTGVDKLHYGLEIGVEGKVTQNITLIGVLAQGMHLYDSRPEVTFTVDNQATVIAERTAFLKNYRVGGSPQTAMSAGFKYFSSKYVWGGANINYYDNIYIEINPDRRTAEGVSNYDPSYPERENILKQEKFDPAFTMDAYIGKSWSIQGYYLSLSFSLSNILDNTDFAFGGFEQFRYDPLDLEKFPPKYFYLYGRQYYLNVNVRF